MTSNTPDSFNAVVASEQPDTAAVAIPAQQAEEQAERFREDFKRQQAEVQKAIVGQENVVDSTLVSLMAGGHVLLEGVPGLGKTFLVRTLSEVLHLEFNRVQFTPDLMPADILGTNLVVDTPSGGKEFRFQAGPIFTNICLADEINRATPKTQSALLEAMQERSVTTGGAIRKLPAPFFVLATQNPLEMEGTYPLPEAQLDRFFFKVNVHYPTLEELMRIVEMTTGANKPALNRIIDGARLIEMQRFVTTVAVSPHVSNYAMRLVLATQPSTGMGSEKVRRFVSYGSSPRGAQALILAGKVRALIQGRIHVSHEDIQWAATPTLRHRLILNFEGEAEGISTDDIVAELLESVPKDAALAANL